MKRISRFLIIAIWITLIYTIFKLNLLSGNLDNLNKFFSSCGNYKALIFIALSSLRIAALIPSAIFMILGGMIFTPTQSFAFTLISVILSGSIVYIASKILVSSGIQNYLTNKYPKFYRLLLRNNTKILAIGILCPIAPSDAACFLASSTGLNYRKFILTIITANIPMMTLYSFLGDSIISSANNTIIVSTIIVLISMYSICLWNKEQRNEKLV